MTDNKTINIIVAVYNTEKYLPKCIESILNQTYRDIRLFLVNDGSTDRSLAICESYRILDSRICVLNKENGGQASARNMALDKIRGGYIAFVDSDDYIKPDMIEKLFTAITQNNADIAICGITFDSGIRTVDSCAKPRVLNNDELIKAYLEDPDIGAYLWNKMYKTEIWDNIRFPTVRMCEDALIIHEILGRSKCCVVIQQPLYVYVQREGSTERKRFTKNDYMHLEWSEALRKYIEMNYIDLLDMAYQVRFYAIVKVMYKILYNLQYRKCFEAYKEFSELLEQEYEKANQLFPHNHYMKTAQGESYLKPLYIQALKHPHLFIICGTIKGLMGKIKRIVKRIWVRHNVLGWRKARSG